MDAQTVHQTAVETAILSIVEHFTRDLSFDIRWHCTCLSNVGTASEMRDVQPKSTIFPVYKQHSVYSNDTYTKFCFVVDYLKWRVLDLGYSKYGELQVKAIITEYWERNSYYSYSPEIRQEVNNFLLDELGNDNVEF